MKTLFVTLVAASWLTGCAGTVSEPLVYSVRVDHYSPMFQLRLADEIEALPAPCDRVQPDEGCSAALRFVLDHVSLRDRVDAVRRATPSVRPD